MPNWCENRVTLTHDDPAMIDKAIKAYESNALFQTFVPMDEALHESGDWYAWRHANWGVKWDIDNCGIDPWRSKSKPNEVEFVFNTAWSPPEAFYERLAETHGFRIKAYYNEPGMCFAGIIETDDDLSLSVDHYDYGEMTADQMQAELPSDLDGAFCIVEEARYQEECQ